MNGDKTSGATAVREFVIDWLRRELVGPSPGYPMVQLNGEEILRPQDPPRYRYGCGILFPHGVRYSGGDPVEHEELAGVSAATEVDAVESADVPTDDADAVQQARTDGAAVEQDQEVNPTDQFLPQTMGISFLARIGEGFEVNAKWGAYSKNPIPSETLWQSEIRRQKPGKDPEYWFRRQEGKTERLPAAELQNRKHLARRVLTDTHSPGRLELDVVSRPWKVDGIRLVTVTLINATESKASLNEKCFFQCSFEVRPLNGCEFLPYPERSQHSLDEDEASLALLYRHRPTYAVGHGCAADWAIAESRVASLRTEVLPVHRQTPIVPRDSIEGVDLRMSTLAAEDGSAIAKICFALASEYEKWIVEQELALSADRELGTALAEAGTRHMERCRECLERIRDGIALLQSDAEVLDAFRLMNRAMLEQREHYALSSETEKRRDWIWTETSFQPERPYAEPAYGDTKWRPFQLAFVLMNLRPMRDPECIERRIVDIIWFPTGGGKTEAYLGLAAYAILLRRLLGPSNGGTTVLMRYTLRLLTTQQFQRAASLICALERMRRAEPDRLGTEPVSIGLWVGSGVTPNAHRKACEAYTRMANGGRENPFVLLSCPWCGIGMGPRERGGKSRIIGYEEVKVAGERKIRFRCEDSQCEFSSDAGLPVAVVDQGIYENPPTLLIGTVDKFAMMPFEPEARRLFGIDTGMSPPDLVIQDELHLISGPLGSMVGHYETVIDELATARVGGKAMPPRIVASTATIARAAEQVRAVYGRDAALFPPQGLRAGESFFALEGRSEMGRAYVGVHAVALSSHITAQVRTLAALLQGPALAEADDDSIDPYWTLMAYFNSLRELGRAATLVQADIKEYLNAVWERIGLTEDLGGAAAKARRRFVNRFKELTSRIQSSDIPEVLQELFAAKGNSDIVDLCYATNMIQVGLDVPRLSLMTIVGQPKGASEYIQASSRIGRDMRKPGLVVTNYNPFKPRDRSHFETFRSYHENAYRYVEPTSVTPFSLPVCERAIHAIAVTLARYRYPQMRASPENGIPAQIASEITECIRNRLRTVSPEEEGRAMSVLRKFFDDWDRNRPNDYGGFNVPPTKIPIMWPAGKELPPGMDLSMVVRQTPTSMRNVDADCEAHLLPHYPVGAAQ
ncbi:helicase-related protein [Bradyrhizobium neotropicale]|uniref:helicase-related protein n=1 Tax=Bradyrhizobium neotropicale TaxID=1497615 RepID=UPI001AD6B6B0|nr:helicase-related protein [Bradyrhizobium neotropicale]MBO4224739.1 helicase [Bradyrhizobium neotropicale]